VPWFLCIVGSSLKKSMDDIIKNSSIIVALLIFVTVPKKCNIPKQIPSKKICLKNRFIQENKNLYKTS
jgi:hypothetical protein